MGERDCRELKPWRDGGVTDGPPRSCQRISQSPAALADQPTVSSPVLTESAPYFAALVISSWITSATTEKARASSETEGPLTTIVPPLVR